MAENIKTKSRGAKFVLTALSIAAAMSGWAWLTATQLAVEADLLQAPGDAAQSNPAPVLQAAAGAAVSLPPRSNLPNLADLPVRGLREVGDAEIISQSPQSQPPAVHQRQNGGGGMRVQAQPQPQPKPKPVRKAKSSK